MKVNLKDINSPCVKCYIHSGFSFSEYNASCQKCEYNIAIQLLKKVLKENDYCILCNHMENLGGGYYDCKLEPDRFSTQCENDFSINWEKAYREYGLDYKD